MGNPKVSRASGAHGPPTRGARGFGWRQRRLYLVKCSYSCYNVLGVRPTSGRVPRQPSATRWEAAPMPPKLPQFVTAADFAAPCAVRSRPCGGAWGNMVSLRPFVSRAAVRGFSTTTKCVPTCWGFGTALVRKAWPSNLRNLSRLCSQVRPTGTVALAKCGQRPTATTCASSPPNRGQLVAPPGALRRRRHTGEVGDASRKSFRRTSITPGRRAKCRARFGCGTPRPT